MWSDFSRFDGILGAELFQDHVVTIDAQRLRLTIEDPAGFKPDKAAVGLPFTFDAADHRPKTYAMPVGAGMVNGIDAEFEIDTSDRSSLTLFGPFWRAHHLSQAIGPTVTTMTGYGLGGPIQGIVGRLRQFTFGRIEVPPPVTRLSLQKAGAFMRSDYAGSIGMGVLKRFFVSFDYAQRMIWLVRRPGFYSPDEFDRSGLWLGLSKMNDDVVVSVTAGGPAAEAGLEAGDTIDEINAISARPKTLMSLRRLLCDPGLQAAVVSGHRGEAGKTFHIMLRNQIDMAE